MPSCLLFLASWGSDLQHCKVSVKTDLLFVLAHGVPACPLCPVASSAEEQLLRQNSPPMGEATTATPALGRGT